MATVYFYMKVLEIGKIDESNWKNLFHCHTFFIAKGQRLRKIMINTSSFAERYIMTENGYLKKSDVICWRSLF